MENKILNINLSDLKERIIKKPFYISWEIPNEHGLIKHHIEEKSELNYEGLNEHEKMLLYIYSWNLVDLCPTKKTIMKEFNFSSYKVRKLFKELKEYGLECVAIFSQSTGLLNGRGYFYNHKNK